MFAHVAMCKKSICGPRACRVSCRLCDVTPGQDVSESEPLFYICWCIYIRDAPLSLLTIITEFEPISLLRSRTNNVSTVTCTYQTPFPCE